MKRAAARGFSFFFFAGGLFYFSPDRLCREFTLKSALLANVTALDVSLPGSEKKKREKKRKDLTGRLGSKFVWSTLMEHMCMGVRTALYKSGDISFFIRSD